MEKNNIKKVIGAVGIGLAVVLSVAVGSKVVGAINQGGVEVVGESDDLALLGMFTGEPDFENFGKYREYGKMMDGTTPTVEAIDVWVSKGYISKEQGDLDKRFLLASSEEEKEKIYDEIVDVIKGDYDLTDAEADRLKDAGYKKHDKTLDEIYIQDIVDAGGMSEEDARIMILDNAAITAEEKAEVLELMVDRHVKYGEITKEQADKIKADGYDNYDSNLWMIRNGATLDELLESGSITE